MVNGSERAKDEERGKTGEVEWSPPFLFRKEREGSDATRVAETIVLDETVRAKKRVKNEGSACESKNGGRFTSVLFSTYLPFRYLL